MLTEAESSGTLLYETARSILHDPARREGMERAMASLGIRDATDRIYATILAIAR